MIISFSQNLILNSVSLLVSFLLGILLSYLWVHRRYQKMWLKQRGRSPYKAILKEDLWDTIIDACYHDFRVQALGGADTDLFELLEDPVLMNDTYVDESPLLPGEVTLLLFECEDAYIQHWEAKKEKLYQLVGNLPTYRRILFLHLFDNFLDTLRERKADSPFYFLYLRTPGYLHLIVLTTQLNEIIAVAPGFSDLHSEVSLMPKFKSALKESYLFQGIEEY